MLNKTRIEPMNSFEHDLTSKTVRKGSRCSTMKTLRKGSRSSSRLTKPAMNPPEVGQQQTNSVEHDLRTGSRSSSKLREPAMEAPENNNTTKKDPSSSESDKPCIAILGRPHSGDEIKLLPFKKRRHMLPSTSVSPQNLPPIEKPNLEHFSADLLQDAAATEENNDDSRIHTSIDVKGSGVTMDDLSGLVATDSSLTPQGLERVAKSKETTESIVHQARVGHDVIGDTTVCRLNWDLNIAMELWGLPGDDSSEGIPHTDAPKNGISLIESLTEDSYVVSDVAQHASKFVQTGLLPGSHEHDGLPESGITFEEGQPAFTDGVEVGDKETTGPDGGYDSGSHGNIVGVNYGRENQSGYDSPFEDGELRELDVIVREENEVQDEIDSDDLTMDDPRLVATLSSLTPQGLETAAKSEGTTNSYVHQALVHKDVFGDSQVDLLNWDLNRPMELMDLPVNNGVEGTPHTDAPNNGISGVQTLITDSLLLSDGGCHDGKLGETGSLQASPASGTTFEAFQPAFTDGMVGDKESPGLDHACQKEDSDVSQGAHVNIVGVKNRKCTQSGFESPFEDGELRESDVIAQEENEVGFEKECVDYDLDDSNANEYDASEICQHDNGSSTEKLEDSIIPMNELCFLPKEFSEPQLHNGPEDTNRSASEREVRPRETRGYVFGQHEEPLYSDGAHRERNTYVQRSRYKYNSSFYSGKPITKLSPTGYGYSTDDKDSWKRSINGNFVEKAYGNTQCFQRQIQHNHPDKSRKPHCRRRSPSYRDYAYIKRGRVLQGRDGGYSASRYDHKISRSSSRSPPLSHLQGNRSMGVSPLGRSENFRSDLQTECARKTFQKPCSAADNDGFRVYPPINRFSPPNNSSWINERKYVAPNFRGRKISEKYIARTESFHSERLSEPIKSDHCYRSTTRPGRFNERSGVWGRGHDTSDRKKYHDRYEVRRQSENYNSIPVPRKFSSGTEDCSEIESELISTDGIDEAVGDHAEV